MGFISTNSKCLYGYKLSLEKPYSKHIQYFYCLLKTIYYFIIGTMCFKGTQRTTLLWTLASSSRTPHIHKWPTGDASTEPRCALAHLLRARVGPRAHLCQPLTKLIRVSVSLTNMGCQPQWNPPRTWTSQTTSTVRQKSTACDLTMCTFLHL